jgi:arylsulfatase A-like enzyme
MQGGENALWVDEKFPYVFTGKARDFILDNKENPFFLYFAIHDVHVPSIVNPDFNGKSSIGPRGDAIAQIDWCVGRITKIIDSLGIAEKTLIIFSSDNGPVLNDGYEDQAEELIGDHKPSGPFRGGKYSAFEAGTRMPTIVCWPGTVSTGISNALISQVDLYASLAKLTGQKPAEGDAEDSMDFLDTWLGKSEKGRDVMLEEAFTFAIRLDEWKYIHPVEMDPPDWFSSKKIESGLSGEVQLFNLQKDPAESENIADENPEVVEEIRKILSDIRADK